MTAHLDTLTAEQILSITNPYELFGTTDYKEQVRKLNQFWHPDKNNHAKASDVSAHINVLSRRAELGDWGNMITVFDLDSDKKEYHFKFKKRVETDVGDLYIGRKLVLFDIPLENEDLYQAGVSSIQNIKYPSKMIEQNFNRFIPKNINQYKSDNGYAVTIYKNHDQICLADLIEANYQFHSGHLSWIVTGLYNFALFMEQAQHKMFGGLSLDGIFINPQFRSVHILGGWWFTQKLGEKLLSLPNWIIPYLPSSIVSNKKSSIKIDQIAIRCLALRLLGDTTMIGSKLLHNKKDETLIRFLRSSPQESLIRDYGEWMKIEKDLPRQDVLMSFNDLYN